MKLQELIAALGSQVRWNVFEFVASFGPANGDQIAAGLETKRHNITRALTELHRYGLVERKLVVVDTHDPGRGAFVYSLSPALRDWVVRTKVTFKELADEE